MDPAADPLLSRIEDAGLNASAPPEQRWLDGWLLRFSPGKAQRARCINAVADGRLPLDQKLALAEAVFREAGLPLLLRLTPFTRPPTLDATLAAWGWRRFDDTRVMTRPDFDAPPADLHPRPLGAEAFAELVGGWRGTPASQRRAHARRLLASPVPCRAFVVEEGGVALACGQFVREAELVGLYDVFTATPARGRGLARALCQWLLRQAAAEGARHAYLQVDADNAPARAVYRRLGFADAYAYHYRSPATAPGQDTAVV